MGSYLNEEDRPYVTYSSITAFLQISIDLKLNMNILSGSHILHSALRVPFLLFFFFFFLITGQSIYKFYLPYCGYTNVNLEVVHTIIIIFLLLLKLDHFD